MKRKLRLASVIAMMLAIIMFIEIPVSAVAPIFGDELASIEVVSDDIVGEDKEANGDILSEIEDERTEYSKTFRLSDGTSMVAQYTMPVHYKDDKGDWVDYDNSLFVTEQEVSVSETQPAVLDEATADSVAVATASEETTFTTNRRTEKKQMFKNRKSNTGISFSKETASENMVLVENDGHAVSWGYKDINIKSAKQKNEKKTRTGNDKFTVLDNLTSTVVYESAYDEVDIECITTPVGVKENIILNKKSATNKFVSTYDIGDLRAEKLNDREIALYNADNGIEYYINALYMYDANNETSEAIVLNILENANGKLVVELVADEQWLNATERVYPVTIDPSFLYGQKWGNVQCTYVDSSKPNTAYGYGSSTGYTGTIYTGTLGTAEYYSLMKINTLPSLNKGDMIVNATVNLYAYNVDFYEDAYVGVYEIKDSWSQSTVTWNNCPEDHGLLIDYFNVNDTSYSNIHCGWDITKLVKKWYNGSVNNGFYLKMINDTAQGAGFYSSNYPSETEIRPVFELTYRNNKGVEGLWSYTSFSVGDIGTVYINDYSGALTFELPVASTADPMIPANVSYVYNSYMANTKYERNAPYFGDGWRMNMQQTLLPSSEYGLTDDAAELFPYVYTDADGTEHYFKKITEDGKTKYCDEDGLELELSINTDEDSADYYSKRYTITDKDKNKRYFHSTGLYYGYSDAYGNYQNVKYDSRTIDYIYDRTGNKIDFTCNSNNYVTSIVDPAGRTTSFTYDSSNNVTSIKYPNKNSQGEDILDKEIVATISYNGDGLITSIQDSDSYKIAFEYNNLKQVVSVVEYGTNGADGQKMTFDRTNYNETIVRTPGVDSKFGNSDNSGNSDDLLTTYQFDNFGRTISLQSNTVDGAGLGAETYTYTSGESNSSGSNIKKVNKITSNHALGANVVNHVRNSNLESDTSWADAQWLGTATFTAVVDTGHKLYGQKSTKLNVTSYEESGAGRTYQDLTYLDIGQTYTLSGYVKVTSLTSTATDDFGAVLCATIFNTDGTTTDNFSDYITEVTDESINDGWRRLSVTFTVPENTSKVRANLALRSAVGTAYFDAIQIESGKNASSYNMVQNGSMELYSNNQPNSWYNYSNITFSNSADGISQVAQDGSASFRIMGDVANNKILYQEIPVSGSENDTYILGAWAKTTTAVPIEDDIKFKITIQVLYDDETKVTKSTPSFNTSITSWQFQSTAFNLSDGTDTEKNPVSIKIFPNYSFQGNRAYFDNIQLVKEPSQSYTYDDEGNLVTVVENAKQNSSLKYNSDNKLTEYTDPKGYKYTYKYNDKGKLESATTQLGATYTYTYDDKDRGSIAGLNGSTTNGLKTTTSQSITFPSVDSTEYSVVTTDQLNRSSTATYNAKTGNTISVSDNIGDTTYSYNLSKNTLTSVSQGDSNKRYSVYYDYDDNWKNLESIRTGTSTYNFMYDVFGNCTSISVKNQPLLTYTYMPYNGNIERIDYGNGDYETFTYDRFGNTSQRSVNGTPVYEGIADSTGAVTKTIDLLNSLQYNYVYDSTDRLVSTTVTDTTDNSRVAMFEYDFDLNNNHTKFSALTQNGSNVTSYSYGKDNLPQTVTFNNEKTLTYSYDSLGRNNKITINTTKDPIVIDYFYHSYKNGDVTYRSNLLGMESSEHFKYRYEFDARNNITVVQEVSYDASNNAIYTPIEEYTYDALNQLTQVDYLKENKRVKYEYDNGGNILSEAIYSLSGDTESLVDTITYTYGDEDWKDKLTSYDGQTITYDEIGNPRTYRDSMTMSWSSGRQLATLTKGNTTVQYTYGTDGWRLSKTVNGVEYTYLYQDGLLVQETRGEMILDYSYDASGRIRMGAYRKNASAAPGYFYYALNTRGDVIGIYESDGDLYAKYTYDVWGNITSITNANGTDISGYTNMATRQPFRYRGYYYDTESGFYYVSSRYYDPVTHRFLNADDISLVTASPTALTDKNLFAYCDNNPITRADEGGELWNFVIGAVVGAGIGAITTALSGGSTEEIILSACVGGLGGLISASGLPLGAQMIAGGILSGGSNFVTQTLIQGKKVNEVNYGDVLLDTAIGATSSFLSDKITKSATTFANKMICKGANKVVNGQQTLLRTNNRYGNGAIKRGEALMRTGQKKLNTARGKSSVLGSFFSGVASSTKSFFKKLFR